MFTNKDEANKCLDLARDHFTKKDYAQAHKFVLKAIKLFPSVEAKELLSKISEGDNPDRDRSESCDNNNYKSQSPHFKNRKLMFPNGNVENVYTKKQQETVKQIQKCKTYYEILGVDKQASDDDLKKSYKKLALKFHPDKNKAPEAVEAFKMIGKGFAVLSDPDKRQRYDETCSIDDSQSRPHNSYSHEFFNCSKGFDSEFFAEELFSMFFGDDHFTGFTSRANSNRTAQLMIN